MGQIRDALIKAMKQSGDLSLELENDSCGSKMLESDIKPELNLVPSINGDWLYFALPEGTYYENELPSDDEMKSERLHELFADLIIGNYRHGEFNVYSTCIAEHPIDLTVNVWRDSEGKFHCDDEGNSDEDKLSEWVGEQKEFQNYVIEQVRKDYSLSENVEDYFDKYDDETYEFFEANPQLAIYQPSL